MTIIIFLGGNYETKIYGTEQYLSQYLSKYTKVFCFEYPHFKTFINLITGKISLVEKKSANLYIYHAFGFVPSWHLVNIINKLNHLFNFIIFSHLLKLDHMYCKFISFTPEIAYISNYIPSHKLIYYVVDNMVTLPQWKNKLQKIQFQKLEKKLLKMCNKVLVVTNTLFCKYKSLHKKVIFFPAPSQSKLFFNFKQIKIPSDMERISHPIAGFMGSFYDWKIDTKTLINAIKNYPHVNFVFIGTLNMNKSILLSSLTKLPNFQFLGIKSVSELPVYVANFDICLIPYRTNKYGHYAYPVKIMEYLALGKPVVSTALPSIKELGDKGIIYWAKNDSIFNNVLGIAIREKVDPLLKKRRMQLAKKNSWEIRIKKFYKLLND